MTKKVKILNTTEIQQKLNRLAFQVYENNYDEKSLLIVGINGNGYKMAEMLVDKLQEISKQTIKLGKVTLNKEEPWKGEIKIDFSEKDFINKNIVIVDDVLNSGKTLIHAVKLFLDKPVKKLSTVVMVERSYKRYPVRADFVGLKLSTTLQERIEAEFSKKGSEAVYLV
jgi:pyrimidine operon attenuation protein/uracil phosphoribosyltransferase